MRRACDRLARADDDQIRNVPDELCRKLTSQAALASQFVAKLSFREIAAQPTREDMLARLQSLSPIEPSIDPVDILRAERDGR